MNPGDLIMLKHAWCIYAHRRCDLEKLQCDSLRDPITGPHAQGNLPQIAIIVSVDRRPEKITNYDYVIGTTFVGWTYSFNVENAYGD